MASSPILSDSFGDSPISTRGPRWTRMTRYWPTLLWNAGTSDPSGFGINPTDAELTDKYRYTQVGACRQHPVHNANARELGMFTHRVDSREDGGAKATFKMVDVRGGAQDFWISNLWAGVACRVTGESGTQFTSGAEHSEQLIAPSGYFFWLLSRKSGSVAFIKFAIHKVTGPASGGGVSTVDELEWILYPDQTQNELFANSSFGLRLTCNTNLGVTELRGYYTNPDGEEELVVSHDEGTGALAEPGHAAFCATCELIDPLGVSDHGFIMGVQDFEVYDSDGDLVMRDEFTRVQLPTTRKPGADAFFTEDPRYGNTISGMVCGDQGSEDATGELPQFGDRVGRHASIAKLQFLDGDDSGFHLFHQPPDNLYAQAFQAQFDFASGGSSETRIVGVCVRRALAETTDHTIISTDVDNTGYTVAMHFDGGSSWVLRVHRQIGNSWQVLAARAMNQTGDPTTVGVGAAWTLRVDIENRDGASASTGNVHLDILVNGERLTGWTIVETSGGVIEEDDGSITDTTSDRLLAGGASGFFVSNKEVGPGGEVYVLNAQQINVPLDLNETEQPSAFVPAEKDYVSGTLTVPHEWPVETRYEDYIADHDLDTAQRSRHEQGSAQRRRWTIASRAAKKAEVDELREFFLGQKGAEVPFYWDTPDGETVIVSMEERSLLIKKIDILTYEFRVTLIELVGSDPQVGATVNFLNSAEPFSGGGFTIIDDPVGTQFPSQPVFHFEDTYGQFSISVEWEAAAREGEILVLDLGGTAVEGTHYTNDTDPGTTRITYKAPAGETTKVFTFTILDTGQYHAERLLTIGINQDLSNVPVHPLDNLLHVWIRPTTAPPEIEFNIASQTVSRGSTAIVQVNKITGAGHEDDIGLFFETSGTAVEGEDFEWIGGPYGTYTLAPAPFTRNLALSILPGADPTRTLFLNLRHEPSDRSERNFWSLTNTLEYQSTENTPKIYPGTPADNAAGPGNAIPPNPVDSWISTDQLDPWGRETVTILKLRDVARGAGYHRKDFQGQTSCGAPHDEEGGGMISMPAYARYSIYFMRARPDGVELPFPDWVRFTFRDRGFSLDPPQVPNATGLGELNHFVVFNSRAGGGAADSDGNTWDVHSTTNWNTDSDAGIEIETFRMSDGSYRDIARLWALWVEDDPQRLGHALVRLWYPIYFGQGAGSGDLEDNKGKAVAVFWPQLDFSATPLSGAPPPYHDRHGFFDGPTGGAVALSGGIVQHEIDITT